MHCSPFGRPCTLALGCFSRQLYAFTRSDDSFVLWPFGLHARSFDWTKDAVTISGSRAFHVVLRRRFGSFRSLLVGHLSRRLLGFGKEVLRFLCLEKKLSPLLAHSPRHRAPSSFRSVHRPPSGVRARSSYGQSFAAAFHLRAAPYCGRLSLSASWGAFAPRRSLAKPHDHLAALAMSCACSPRHSPTTLRDLLSDLTSGRTCSRSLSFRSSNMPASWGGHARSPFEQSHKRDPLLEARLLVDTMLLSKLVLDCESFSSSSRDLCLGDRPSHRTAAPLSRRRSLRREATDSFRNPR